MTQIYPNLPHMAPGATPPRNAPQHPMPGMSGPPSMPPLMAPARLTKPGPRRGWIAAPAVAVFGAGAIGVVVGTLVAVVVTTKLTPAYRSTFDQCSVPDKQRVHAERRGRPAVETITHTMAACAFSSRLGHGAFPALEGTPRRRQQITSRAGDAGIATLTVESRGNPQSAV